jgi:hypothetical protein
MSNTNAMLHRVAGYGPVRDDWEMLEGQVAQAKGFQRKFPHWALRLWLYPGFNESAKVMHDRRKSIRWLPRDRGRSVVRTLERYVGHSPDFLMVSSWNDWQENSAIEPGPMYEGYEGDPYLYCRIFAQVRGKTFAPAALPPKESVDPWMWQMLYGLDHRSAGTRRAAAAAQRCGGGVPGRNGWQLARRLSRGP